MDQGTIKTVEHRNLRYDLESGEVTFETLSDISRGDVIHISEFPVPDWKYFEVEVVVASNPFFNQETETKSTIKRVTATVVDSEDIEGVEEEVTDDEIALAILEKLDRIIELLLEMVMRGEKEVE